MGMTQQESNFFRDHLFSLKTNNKKVRHLIYQSARSLFIERWEGFVPRVYDDGLGYQTVGIGYNMDLPDANQVWKIVFPDGPFFNDIYTGKKGLTHEQAYDLFDHVCLLKEQEVKKIYAGIWECLFPNEQLAIESAYYNAPSLVWGPNKERSGTCFFEHMKNYATHKDLKALQQAVFELKERSSKCSNPAVRAGLQARRNSEATLLASYESPIYSLMKKIS